MEYRHRENESLSEEERSNLDDVEAMIRTRMTMKGLTPKYPPFKEQVKGQSLISAILLLIFSK